MKVYNKKVNVQKKYLFLVNCPGWSCGWVQVFDPKLKRPGGTDWFFCSKSSTSNIYKIIIMITKHLLTLQSSDPTPTARQLFSVASLQMQSCSDQLCLCSSKTPGIQSLSKRKNRCFLKVTFHVTQSTLFFMKVRTMVTKHRATVDNLQHWQRETFA